MDFSLDKLLESKNGMNTFMELKEEKDQAKALAKLAEAGSKIEPSEKITITL